VNVAFTCKGLSQLTEEKLFEVLGAPESEKLARLDGEPLDEGVPNQLVKAAGWFGWVDEYDEDLRIFDFGETFLKGAEPECLAQPRQLKAPETIFTDSYDYRLDLWRAGIMVRTVRLKLLAKDTDICLGRYSHSYFAQDPFSTLAMISWSQK
jgi:serine/threonine-protein kinase SRPK3